MLPSEQAAFVTILALICFPQVSRPSVAVHLASAPSQAECCRNSALPSNVDRVTSLFRRFNVSVHRNALSHRQSSSSLQGTSAGAVGVVKCMRRWLRALT